MKFVNLIVSSWLPLIPKCGLTLISGCEGTVFQHVRQMACPQSEISAQYLLACSEPALTAPDEIEGTWRKKSHIATPTLIKFKLF